MSSMKNFLKFDFNVLVFFNAVVIIHHFGRNPEDLITTTERKKTLFKYLGHKLTPFCILEK